MNIKKSSKNWYVGATHYITAGLFIPFLAGGLLNGLWHYLTESYEMQSLLVLQTELFLFSFAIILKLFILWLGIIYSANYICKTYNITKKNVIVNFATVFFVIFSLPLKIFFSTNTFLVSLVYVTIMSTFFWYMSNKYIKNTI